MRAIQNRYMVAMLLPIALLAMSFAATPSLFSVSSLRETISPLTKAPVLLYQRGSFAVYYTSQDLLHPETFGKPGQFYQAVVYDVWPAGEGNSAQVHNLTWIGQINFALKVQDANGNPLTYAQATDEDRKVAGDFLREFIGPPRLERGKTFSFLLPAVSTYRKLSGIELMLALAVKNPDENRFYPTLKGSPQLFAPALEAASRMIAQKNLTGIGVPFIPVSGSLGQSASQTSAWKTILEEVDRRVSASGIKKVVLGGYGLVLENQEQTDRAFRQAWTEWRGTLGEDAHRAVHEQIRLAALVSLAAFAGALWRRKVFTWQRLIAILVISAALALSVVNLFDWAQPLLPAAISGMAALFIKAVLAAIAGLFIDYIVGFEPKAALKKEF
jgi:hypothetical protein